MPMERLVFADKETKTPKDTAMGSPTHYPAAYAAAVQRLGKGSLAPVANRQSSEVPSLDEMDSRDLVRYFLSALAPARPSGKPTFKKDIEALNRAIHGIVSAAQEDVITPEEADAVIRYIIECFTVRRLDSVLTHVTSPKRGAWFMVGQSQVESKE